MDTDDKVLLWLVFFAAVYFLLQIAAFVGSHLAR